MKVSLLSKTEVQESLLSMLRTFSISTTASADLGVAGISSGISFVLCQAGKEVTSWMINLRWKGEGRNLASS